MKKWKRLYEKALEEEYHGVKIKWIGDDPILVVPDKLASKKVEIVEFATVVWAAWGGEVKFFPERAVHTVR